MHGFIAKENNVKEDTANTVQMSILMLPDTRYKKEIWFGLCCLMTPGLSKDIHCLI